MIEKHLCSKNKTVLFICHSIFPIIMKTSALGFSLILLMVPLAGCAGSDTDVNVDISSEELQQMIDDNKDDFLNNTTVVVFQEYHNNTTIVNNNQYDNNTSNNYDQKDTSSSTTTNYINGSEVDYETYVVRLEWNASDYTTEPEYYNPRENKFTIGWN